MGLFDWHASMRWHLLGQLVFGRNSVKCFGLGLVMSDVLHFEPGVYEGISWSDYLRIPYMSPSTLKHGTRSMKRLKRAIDGEIKYGSKAIGIGNAVHTEIAGEFDERVAVLPQFELSPENLTAGTKSTKTKPKNYLKSDGNLSAAGIKWNELCEQHGKAADFDGEIVMVTGRKHTESKATNFYKNSVAQFYEENRGNVVLSQSEMDIASRSLQSLRACEGAVELIKSSVSEVTVIAEIEGVMCKTRMDGLNMADLKGWDLKTTNDIDPFAFYRTVKKLGYLFQFGFHDLALRNAGKDSIQLLSYDIIALETQDDFDCGVIGVQPYTLIQDWAERVQETLKEYKLAVKRNEWPGLYPNGDVLHVPNWEMSDAQFEG